MTKDSKKPKRKSIAKRKVDYKSIVAKIPKGNDRYSGMNMMKGYNPDERFERAMDEGGPGNAPVDMNRHVGMLDSNYPMYRGPTGRGPDTNIPTYGLPSFGKEYINYHLGPRAYGDAYNRSLSRAQRESITRKVLRTTHPTSAPSGSPAF